MHETINNSEYEACFSEEVHKEAYRIAFENLKLETENYWKRTNYYWLFQASIYAGYFFSITTEKSKYLFDSGIIVVGITCLGFLTAFAWCLTNKGSKQWHQNWVNHVYKLEDKVTGPLYKVMSGTGFWSVTKINEYVSLFSVIAWALLGVKTIYSFYGYHLFAFAIYATILIIIVLVFCIKGKSSAKQANWFKRGEKQEKCQASPTNEE
ncbi:MAG: hypothetical protein FWC94_06435 [Bacteroidales bacterium]|nr:hypothetical protein [Bacteroidales bacterium]